jgi:hypothetical protein
MASDCRRAGDDEEGGSFRALRKNQFRRPVTAPRRFESTSPQAAMRNTLSRGTGRIGRRDGRGRPVLITGSGVVLLLLLLLRLRLLLPLPPLRLRRQPMLWMLLWLQLRVLLLLLALLWETLRLRYRLARRHHPLHEACVRSREAGAGLTARCCCARCWPVRHAADRAVATGVRVEHARRFSTSRAKQRCSERCANSSARAVREPATRGITDHHE